MRVIAGCRRGHKLFEFDGMDIRPTTDRVKEAMFNLIQGHIQGAAVLDMFAGSGGLSFEAISRGAVSAVLIDRDKRALDVIKRNITALGFENLCSVKENSCFDYAKKCGKSFDLIFLDPPYNKGFIKQALCAVVENKLLNDNGLVVLESDITDFKDSIEGLEIIKQKRYGRSFVTVYTRAE